MQAIDTITVSVHGMCDCSALLSRVRFQLSQMSEYSRAVGPIVGLNLLVFLLWRVPRLSSVMQRYFICSPRSSSVSSLLVGLWVIWRASSAPFHTLWVGISQPI